MSKKKWKNTNIASAFKNTNIIVHFKRIIFIFSKALFYDILRGTFCIDIKQTGCSRGCSRNTFVTHSLIDKLQISTKVQKFNKINLDVTIIGVLFVVCFPFFVCRKGVSNGQSPPHPIINLFHAITSLPRPDQKGTKKQRDKGTKGQRYKGTKGHRDKGT